MARVVVGNVVWLLSSFALAVFFSFAESSFRSLSVQPLRGILEGGLRWLRRVDRGPASRYSARSASRGGTLFRLSCSVAGHARCVALAVPLGFWSCTSFLVRAT